MLLYGETDTALTPKLIIDAQTGISDTINSVTGNVSNDIYFNNKNNTLVFNTTETFKPDQLSIFNLSGRKIVTSSLPSQKGYNILPLHSFWKYSVPGRYILLLKNMKEETRLLIAVE